MGEVRAKKALGQHFLTDMNIARRIAEALDEGERAYPADVLEVGCGTGVLTRFLLERRDITVWGVEIDTESVDYLAEHFPAFVPRLMSSDFLRMDLAAMFPQGVRIIG